MRKIGFSTGALAYADFRRALEMLKPTSANVVELSALRIGELAPLMEAVGSLALEQFSSFISIHAPSNVDAATEKQIVSKLSAAVERKWPIVVHPDSIHDVALWRHFGRLLCIENMDKRKPIGRTRDELEIWFEKLPEASLCLDLGHARQIDPSMTEAYLILRDFGDRLTEVHLSEVSFECRHERISLGASFAFREIASLIPADVPIILESVVAPDLINAEIKAAHEALPLDTPRKQSLAKGRNSSAFIPIHP